MGNTKKKDYTYLKLQTVCGWAKLQDGGMMVWMQLFKRKKTL